MRIKQFVVAALGLATGFALHAQVGGGQWLIEKIEGSWEIRDKGASEKAPARPLSDRYDVLTTSHEIRCLAQPCKLWYFNGELDRVLEMTLPGTPAARLRKWIAVPEPQSPPVALAAPAVWKSVEPRVVRGGAGKAGPTCSGTLPLKFPACGETVAAADFQLQWAGDASDAGKTFSLMIGGTDGFERKRWNSIPAEAGEYQNAEVQAYLSGIESADRPTSVTLRLIRSEKIDAVRLIQLPSKTAETEYRKSVQNLSLLSPDAQLARSLETLALLAVNGMWSKAAEVSRHLIRDAPHSVEIRKYALVGLCPSGPDGDEVRALRDSLREAGVTGLCDAGATSQ